MQGILDLFLVMVHHPACMKTDGKFVCVIMCKRYLRNFLRTGRADNVEDAFLGRGARSVGAQVGHCARADAASLSHVSLVAVGASARPF